MEISWDLVEPQKGQYDFALHRPQGARGRAREDRRAGPDRPLPGVGRAASGQPVLLAARPRGLRRLRQGPRRALRARAARCGASTPRSPPRPVRAWQVWNEPNLAVYWAEQPFMRGYARLLNAADAAIKQRRPRRHGGDGRPGQLLLARPRAAVRQGRGEAALRRRRGAPVQRAARPTP